MAYRSSGSITKPLACGVLLATAFAVPAFAQRVRSSPATDSSAQASPLNARSNSPVDDGSMQASPISSGRSSGPSVAPHTPVPITLGEDIDSGHIKQGQNLKARLAAPVSVHGGPTLPAGTPVELSVIAAVPAGRMMAQGELSLQVLRIGNLGVYTDTLVFDGKPGHQDLPDSAPALGTDAGLASGTSLTFHVQPAPSADVSPLEEASLAPGSVNGTASGSAPPSSKSNQTYNDPNGVAGSQNAGHRVVAPADTTTGQQVQNLARPGAAPNQPQAPSGGSPTTAPRL